MNCLITINVTGLKLLMYVFDISSDLIGKYLREKVVFLLYLFWLVILFELCVVWMHLIGKRM